MANPNFSTLLQIATTQPGSIMKAYSAFHSYSLGNQLLALFECQARGIEPGPIKTFPGWKDLGRHVKKGEKAITLCMPVTVKRKKSADNEAAQDVTFTTFVYKPRWFVLSQTEGQEIEAPSIPGWSSDQALSALDIQRVEFSALDGNCQGYAQKRSVAINPVAQLPHKTLFHEIAHLCWLRSYVVLAGQVVWNEALVGPGLYITLPSIPPSTVAFRDRRFFLSESAE